MRAKQTQFRWLAFIALIVLLTPVIAACGGGGGGGGQPTTAPAAPTTAPAAQTAAPAGQTAAPAGQTAAPSTTETAPAEQTAGPSETAPAGQTPSAEGTSSTGAARTGTKGGTMVVGIVQEPDILDPFVTGMTFSVWVLHTLETPLIRAKEKGALEPMLLKEVPTGDNGGITQDGKTYKIDFKEGLKWSDGQPLTAKDLVFTWKTVMSPDYGAGSTLGWEQIKDIKLTNNDLTATIMLKQAYAPFLAYVLAGTGDTTGGMILPEHKFKGKSPKDYTKSDYGLAGSAGHVGSGPFKIESWKKGDTLTVVRNDNYFAAPALLDKMVFSVLENTDQQTTQLQNGDIDVSTNYTEGDIPTLQNLSGQGVQLIANPAIGSIERFIFNLKDPKDPNLKTDPAKAKDNPIFSDKNVRLAIVMGMNRPAITGSLLYGKTKPGVTELDNTKWFNKSLQPYPFDPNKAKQMLDQAGWKPGGDGIRVKNGVRLSFTHVTTSGNPLRERVQRGVINDLKNIGAEMKIANQKPDKLFASFSQGGVAALGQFDIAGYTTGITPLDPDLTTFYATSQIPSKKNNGVGGNNGRYSNPQVDKLLQQQAAEVDPAKRQPLLDQIQKLVFDDVPVVYMYDRLRIDAVSAKVKGTKPDPTAGLWWNPEDWYLQGGQ